MSTLRNSRTSANPTTDSEQIYNRTALFLISVLALFTAATAFSQEVNAIDGTKLEEANKAVSRTPDQDAIVAAGQAGDRMTLKADSAIPMAMAVIYLLILLYFKSIGGYKVVTIDEMPDEKASLRD
jgi:hypothetical protein